MVKDLDPKAGRDYLAQINSAGDEKTRVLHHLPPSGQKSTIVEIGPGGGSALKIIMEKIADLDEEARPLVSILDISDEVLRQVEDFLRTAGIQSGFETRQGDISKEVPYEDGSIQAINLSSVLHECFSYGGGEEGIRTFVGELNRILAINGVVAYRDMNGVDLEKPASFKLRTRLSSRFMTIFFAKYFDNKHTKYKKPNHRYLNNLRVDEELDGPKIDCDAGLAHEFKRHLILFTKNILPEAMYLLLTPTKVGFSRISFTNSEGKKKFMAFLKRKEIPYSESDSEIEIPDQTIAEFQLEVDGEIDGLFSDCEIILENEDDAKLLSQFLGNNDIKYSKEGTKLKVDLKGLVLVYSKFKQLVLDQNMKAKFANEKHEKLLDWFEREGEESYFYGDQLGVITKFLEYSLTEDPNNSLLGHTCLVPMGMNEIITTQRQNYTAYILGQIEDIEGSYEDGKNTITFVKRPVEAIIPTLLSIYEKTGDVRILKSLKLIMDMIDKRLESADNEKERAILDRHIAEEQETRATDTNGERVYGLIGGIASGKSTAAETFRAGGFEIIELSDFIRTEIEAAGITLPTRDHYFEFGNTKRRKDGNDAFSNLAIEEIERRGLKKTVISGIRTPEDVRRLRQRFPSFRAVAIDTPLGTRIARITDRMRDIDPRDKDKIIADIMREWEDVVEEGCKLKNTIAEADITIDGSQNVETMKRQCVALISQNK